MKPLYSTKYKENRQICIFFYEKRGLILGTNSKALNYY